MNSEDRFHRVAELFDHARILPSDDREPFLRRQCSGDNRLANEVMELLEQHEASNGFLEQPIATETAFAQITEMTKSDAAHPPRIGRYEIRRVLGQGGMGIVYLAEQHNPRRKVAVKVMSPDLVGGEAMRRFELETALLGRLQHPGIAQIYDAGMHDNGLGNQPFFAMEFVDGAPLIEHVNRHHASIPARLELFTRICETVHYAHQKGVIHRDLKPGNILVTRSAADVQDEISKLPTTSKSVASSWLPKILDFGVARATDSDLKQTSLHTKAGQLIGTLPYMSPEQIVGRAQEVDTRSDVYALGVIMYELLTGQLPHELKGYTIVEAAKRITEREPKPLSDVNRDLRGDVNTIVMRALAKVPDHRYQSANDLSADVQRFLADQPIDARPLSTLYQLSKFAKRNRGLVAGLALAILMLVVGVIATSVFAIGKMQALQQSETHLQTAEKKQKKAEENFEQARQAIDRLTELSRNLSTVAGTDQLRQEALNEVLAFYLNHVDESDDPEVAFEVARTYRRIAIIRRDLNQFADAVKDLLHAREILNALHQKFPDDVKYVERLADNHFQVGVLFQRLKQTQASAENFLKSADLFLSCWKSTDRNSFQIGRASALNNASVQFHVLGKTDQALELNAQAMKLFQSHGDDDSIYSLRNHGLVFESQAEYLSRKGQWAEAIPFYEKAVEILDKASGLKGGDAEISDYVARIHHRLGQSHLLTDPESNKWIAHEVHTRELYQSRWKSRPDRPVFGHWYAKHCFDWGKMYWFADETKVAEELFGNAIETLGQIKNRFPDFSHDLPGHDEIAYRLCFLWVTCPIDHLRDDQAALKLSRETLLKLPESQWAYICATLVEALVGDIEAAAEMLEGEPWFDQSSPANGQLVKLVIKHRRGQSAISESDMAFLRKTRDDPNDYAGIARLLADRTILMVEKQK